MEAIQLELFDMKPQSVTKIQLITKMKIYKDWILVDNRDRDIEKSVKLKHHYPLVVNLKEAKIYDSTYGESQILQNDKNAKKIDIIHYIQISNVLRSKKIMYNKKKFQLENKK